MIIEPKIEMPAVNNVLSIFVVICQAEMYRLMERLQYLVYQQNTWQDYLANDCVISLISDSEDLAQRFYSFSHALREKKGYY